MPVKRLQYEEAMALTTRRLADGGVFLSVGGEKPNTMTIGWATMGYLWKKPVFVAMVRPLRHTYALLQQQGSFTVSVPTKNALKGELAFAGSKSGRDVDKFQGHGLTALPAQTVSAPIVGECGLHFECRVLLTQDMTGDRMDPGVRESCYPREDYHVMFFGEILDCYTTDE